MHMIMTDYSIIHLVYDPHSTIINSMVSARTCMYRPCIITTVDLADFVVYMVKSPLLCGRDECIPQY